MKLDTGRASVRMLFLLAAILASVVGLSAQTPTWGLLASPAYDSKPVKGMYFFPGNPIHPPGLATSLSDKQFRDDNWDDPTIVGMNDRNLIVREIASLGTNVIFAVYNGPYTDIQFVNNTQAAFLGVFFASMQTNGPVVVPSLEASFQCGGKCPDKAAATFDPARDIGAKTQVAAKYILQLVTLMQSNGVLSKWAQIYDRSGTPRYAIQIPHAATSALKPLDDAGYFGALAAIQQQVLKQTQINIGFVLTPVEDDTNYSIIHSDTGMLALLQNCPSCLAILPYFSEISRVTQYCEQYAQPPLFRGFIDCNAGGDITGLAIFKKYQTKLWVSSGAPYYVDLEAGYDAHLVFNKMSTTDPNTRSVNAVWGETAYIYDKWRNAQSELKGHQGDGSPGSSGVVFNTWNGFTEVSTARDSTHLLWDPNLQICKFTVFCETVGYPYPVTPSSSQTWAQYDFKDLRRRWITDVFSADPRLCDHYYYENGLRTFHVFGAICEKFTEKYGEYGPLGAPVGNAYPSGTRTVEDFASGQIYWNNQGAHEMHGGVYARYKTLLQNGRHLGAPLTDETITPDGIGAYNHFESGSIYWTPTTLGVGIWGPFQDRWAALGWEQGRLSYPVLEPTQTPGMAGWFQRFTGGNLYARSNVAPAFEVWGGILAEYGRIGWETSWLGYPLTGEGDSARWCPDGKFNQFEHGFIDWCPGRSACSHHGDGHCDDGRTSPNS